MTLHLSFNISDLNFDDFIAQVYRFVAEKDRHPERLIKIINKFQSTSTPSNTFFLILFNNPGNKKAGFFTVATNL